MSSKTNSIMKKKRLKINSSEVLHFKIGSKEFDTDMFLRYHSYQRSPTQCPVSYGLGGVSDPPT